MRPAGSESGGGGRRASGRRRSVVGRRAGSREAPGASVLPDNWVYLTVLAVRRASRALWILASVFAPSAFHWYGFGFSFRHAR